MDIQEMNGQQTLNRSLKYPKAISYYIVALTVAGNLRRAAYKEQRCYGQE